MKLVKLLLIIGLVVWAVGFSAPDKQLRVVWCDVGQGDAILVMRGTNQMLIDGGPPNKRVIDCLANHIPFWDRKIEVVVLTHPDADHAGGIAEVINRYNVLHFVSVPVGKDSGVYKEVVEAIERKKIKVTNAYLGDAVKLGGVEFEVLWPPRDWVLEMAEGGNKAEVGSGVLGAKTSLEVNEFSIGGVVRFGEFEVLVTGDADGLAMAEQVASGRIGDVEIAKAPHHGSRFAANEEWWKAASPQMAVISVGKNNYGHPHEAILGLLSNLDIKAMRTDLDGEIEVVSDGNKWWIKD